MNEYTQPNQDQIEYKNYLASSNYDPSMSKQIFTRQSIQASSNNDQNNQQLYQQFNGARSNRSQQSKPITNSQMMRYHYMQTEPNEAAERSETENLNYSLNGGEGEAVLYGRDRARCGLEQLDKHQFLNSQESRNSSSQDHRSKPMVCDLNNIATSNEHRPGSSQEEQVCGDVTYQKNNAIREVAEPESPSLQKRIAKKTKLLRNRIIEFYDEQESPSASTLKMQQYMQSSLSPMSQEQSEEEDMEGQQDINQEEEDKLETEQQVSTVMSGRDSRQDHLATQHNEQLFSRQSEDFQGMEQLPLDSVANIIRSSESQTHRVLPTEASADAEMALVTGNMIQYTVRRRDLAEDNDQGPFASYEDPDERPIRPSPTREVFGNPEEQIRNSLRTQRIAKQRGIGNNTMMVKRPVDLSVTDDDYGDQHDELGPQQTRPVQSKISSKRHSMAKQVTKKSPKKKKNQSGQKKKLSIQMQQSDLDKSKSAYISILQSQGVKSKPSQPTKKVQLNLSSFKSRPDQDQSHFSQRKKSSVSGRDELTVQVRLSKQKMDLVKVSKLNLEEIGHGLQMNTDRQQDRRKVRNYFGTKQSLEEGAFRVPQKTTLNLCISKASAEQSPSVSSNGKQSKSPTKQKALKGLMVTSARKVQMRKTLQNSPTKRLSSNQQRLQTFQSIDQEISDLSEHEASRMVSSKIKGAQMGQVDKNKSSKKVAAHKAPPTAVKQQISLNELKARKALQKNTNQSSYPSQVKVKNQEKLANAKATKKGQNPSHPQQAALNTLTKTTTAALTAAELGGGAVRPQKPAKAMKTNNNIGSMGNNPLLLMQHSKSNSLSTNQTNSLKVIPQTIKQKNIQLKEKNQSKQAKKLQQSQLLHSQRQISHLQQKNAPTASNAGAATNPSSAQKAKTTKNTQLQKNKFANAVKMIDHVTYDPSHENLDERGLNSFKNAKIYNNLKNSSQTRDPNEGWQTQLSPKMANKVSTTTPTQVKKYRSTNRFRGTTNNVDSSKGRQAAESSPQMSFQEQPYNQQNNGTFKEQNTERQRSNRNLSQSRQSRQQISGNNQDPNPQIYSIQSSGNHLRKHSAAMNSNSSLNLRNHGSNSAMNEMHTAENRNVKAAMNLPNDHQASQQNRVHENPLALDFTQLANNAQYNEIKNHNQDGPCQDNTAHVFQLSSDRPIQFDQPSYTQRFSMPLEDKNHLIGEKEKQSSILKKNSSIKSPINKFIRKVNHENSTSINEVQKVAESSFAALPNKIVLPYKHGGNKNMSSVQNHRLNQTNQQRRDRSQTHHLPSSSMANKFDSEYKTHRMDNNQNLNVTQNKLQNRVRFDENNQVTQSVRNANLSVTSAGPMSNCGNSNQVRELSSLKQMRDHRKVSKSIQKIHAFNSNQSDKEASNRGDEIPNLQELYMDDKQIQLGYKLKDIQTQLEKLNETSFDKRKQSNPNMPRRLRSSSYQRAALALGIQGGSNAIGFGMGSSQNLNSHSTSQKELSQSKKDMQPSQLQQVSLMNLAGGSTVGLPPVHGRLYSMQVDGSQNQNHQRQYRPRLNSQTSQNSQMNNSSQAQPGIMMESGSGSIQNLPNQQYQQPGNFTNFNSTTKKVMIDLSINQNKAHQGFIQPPPSHHQYDNQAQPHPTQSNPMRKFNLNQNDMDDPTLGCNTAGRNSGRLGKQGSPKALGSGQIQTTLAGQDSASFGNTSKTGTREKSKSQRRNLLKKHDTMTEKLSRELLQQTSNNYDGSDQEQIIVPEAYAVNERLNNQPPRKQSGHQAAQMIGGESSQASIRSLVPGSPANMLAPNGLSQPMSVNANQQNLTSTTIQRNRVKNQTQYQQQKTYNVKGIVELNKHHEDHSDSNINSMQDAYQNTRNAEGGQNRVYSERFFTNSQQESGPFSQQQPRPQNKKGNLMFSKPRQSHNLNQSAHQLPGDPINTDNQVAGASASNIKGVNFNQFSQN